MRSTFLFPRHLMVNHQVMLEPRLGTRIILQISPRESLLDITHLLHMMRSTVLLLLMADLLVLHSLLSVMLMHSGDKTLETLSTLPVLVTPLMHLRVVTTIHPITVMLQHLVL